MLRLYSLVILLHAFIGWRLLPEVAAFGIHWAGLLGVWLALSAWLMPQALIARRKQHRTLSDALVWAGSIAMGSFSSLFVLTVLREMGLLAAGMADLFRPGLFSMGELQSWSAIAVPLLAGVLTAVGFFNARRNAVVRSVDVSIAGLPNALHGFTIAQISDIHVGPTI